MRLASLTAFAVLLASSAYSQEAKPPVKEEAKHEAAVDKARTVKGGAGKGIKACHKDIDRWCKDVTPGEGRLGACLKGHVKELSKPCRRWAAHGGKEHAADTLARDLDGAPPPAPQAK